MQPLPLGLAINTDSKSLQDRAVDPRGYLDQDVVLLESFGILKDGKSPADLNLRPDDYREFIDWLTNGPAMPLPSTVTKILCYYRNKLVNGMNDFNTTEGMRLKQKNLIAAINEKLRGGDDAKDPDIMCASGGGPTSPTSNTGLQCCDDLKSMMATLTTQLESVSGTDLAPVLDLLKEIKASLSAESQPQLDALAERLEKSQLDSLSGLISDVEEIKEKLGTPPHLTQPALIDRAIEAREKANEARVKAEEALTHLDTVATNSADADTLSNAADAADEARAESDKLATESNLLFQLAFPEDQEGNSGAAVGSPKPEAVVTPEPSAPEPPAKQLGGAIPEANRSLIVGVQDASAKLKARAQALRKLALNKARRVAAVPSANTDMERQLGVREAELATLRQALASKTTNAEAALEKARRLEQEIDTLHAASVTDVLPQERMASLINSLTQFRKEVELHLVTLTATIEKSHNGPKVQELNAVKTRLTDGLTKITSLLDNTEDQSSLFRNSPDVFLDLVLAMLESYKMMVDANHAELDQLGRSHADYETLQTQATASAARITELEAQLAARGEPVDIDKLRGNLQAAHAEITSHAEAIRAATERAAAAEARSAAAEARSAAAEAREHEMAATLQTKTDEAAAAAAALEAEKQETAKAEAKIAEHGAAAAAITAALEAEKQETAKAEAKIAEHGAAAAEAADRAAAAEAREQTIAAALQAKTDEVASVTAALQAKQHEAETAIATHGAAAAEQALAAEQREQATAAALQTKTEEAATTAAALQTKTEEAATTAAALQTKTEEAAATSVKLKAKRREVAAALEEVATLRARVEAAGADSEEVARLTHELGVAANEIAALRPQLEEARAGIRSLEARLSTEAASRGPIEEQLRAAEAELARHKSSSAAANGRALNAASQLHDLHRQYSAAMERLSAEVASKQAALEALQGTTATHEAELRQATQGLASMQAALASSQTNSTQAAAAANARIAVLEAALREEEMDCASARRSRDAVTRPNTTQRNPLNIYKAPQTRKNRSITAHYNRLNRGRTQRANRYRGMLNSSKPGKGIRGVQIAGTKSRRKGARLPKQRKSLHPLE